MSPAPETSGDSEFSDTDSRWLARLTATTDAPVQVRGEPEIEADALRRALKLEHDAADLDAEMGAALSPAERQRRWEQLQFRLRREGLVERRPTTTWRKHWVPIAAAALAAGIVAFAVLGPDLDFGGGKYGKPPIALGSMNSAVVVDDHPRRAAESRAEALRRAGLQPRVYRDGSTYVVDVDVTEETDPAALVVVRSAGVQPKIGLNRILIKPPKN